MVWKMNPLPQSKPDGFASSLKERASYRLTLLLLRNRGSLKKLEAASEKLKGGIMKGYVIISEYVLSESDYPVCFARLVKAIHNSFDRGTVLLNGNRL